MYFALFQGNLTINPTTRTSSRPVRHARVRVAVWKRGLSLYIRSIWLGPGAPSSIEVSIWKYHSDPDINQSGSSGRERGKGRGT